MRMVEKKLMKQSDVPLVYVQESSMDLGQVED
jgi:hypothetical protein